MLTLEIQRSDPRNRSGRYSSISCPTGRAPARLISLEAWADSSALFFASRVLATRAHTLLSVISTALKSLAVLTRSVAAYVAPSAKKRARCPPSVISSMITPFRLPFFSQATPAYVLLLLHEAPARSRFDRCLDRVWQRICSSTVDRKVLIASHSVELCSVQEVQRVLKI